jgi:hypothetical protein
MEYDDGLIACSDDGVIIRSDRNTAFARRLGDGPLMDPTRRCRPIRVMRKSSASRKD